MKYCQHHLKICFRKRLKLIVITQDMQPIKTIVYNVFQQTLEKKTISHRGATLWANVEQQFKDISHNTFCNQNRSFLLLQYE